MRRSLEIWKMGTVNYLEALKLQEKLASDRKALKITDTLLSLQHPLTYRVGKRETIHNLLIPDSELKAIGAELHYTQRGGDITFHGPHQAILYPIVSLRHIGLGARKYVEKLELTMIELASMYGVKAQVGNKCETGVWVEDRKIGAIGVRISSGITSHGLAFNMDPDLDYFKHIVPCGIVDKDVTSLRKEADVELPAEEVIQEQLIACFVKNEMARNGVLYEVFPMSFLMEQAGGQAFTGKERALDLVPTKIHERAPVFLGSYYDVEEIKRLYAAEEKN